MEFETIQNCMWRSGFRCIGASVGWIALSCVKHHQTTSIANANAADASEVWEDLGSLATLENVSILSGSGNPLLAQKVADKLGIKLCKASVSRFADGETNVQIEESVRGQDVYVIQPTSPPVNDNLMELFLMISSLNRASAGRVTAVIPYFGYARQDRKREARETIAAADISRLLNAVGVDHVLAVDLHRGQIQGFFDCTIPVDNLDPKATVIVPYLLEKDLYRPVVVSPSETGTHRVQSFRKDLMQAGVDAGIAFVVPKGQRGSVVEVEDQYALGTHHRVSKHSLPELVGDVTGCDVVIVDDMVDTGSRMVLAAEAVKQAGALRVIGVCTHGLLSGREAIETIENSQLDELVVCDTVAERLENVSSSKIKYVSVSGLIAQAIAQAHKKKSLSTIVDQEVS